MGRERGAEAVCRLGGWKMTEVSGWQRLGNGEWSKGWGSLGSGVKVGEYSTACMGTLLRRGNIVVEGACWWVGIDDWEFLGSVGVEFGEELIIIDKFNVNYRAIGSFCFIFWIIFYKLSRWICIIRRGSNLFGRL